MENKIENEVKNEKKKGKGSIVVIVILLILILALGGYVIFDKVYNNMTNCVTEEEKKDTNSSKEKDKEKDTEKDTENGAVKEETINPNTVETRQCVGVYSGDAPIYMDARTKEAVNGLLSVELKSDGTYELKKDNNLESVGDYVIVEDALLLKTGPHTCGSGQDCSSHYSQFLYVSDDCSYISGGYGSYFFGNEFKINKIN